MFALKRLMPAASLILLTTLAGCGDSLSPADVDPVDLENSLSNASDVFTGNAALNAVSTLSDHFPILASPAMGLLRSTMLRASSPTSGAAATATLRSARDLANVSLSPQALFPVDVLGKTFTWDQNTSEYALSAAAGAPANGIRIVLYFANPATGLPFLPLTPIGNLDLTDKSTPQADKLGVTLTFSQATVASYDITVVAGTTNAVATAAGFVRSAVNSDRVDFTFSDAISVVGQALRLVSTNDLTGDGASIHVVLTVPDLSSGNATIQADVSKNRNGLSLTATGDFGEETGPITGNVKFNGTQVANITGTFEDPSIGGTPGHELSPEEITSLFAIFDASIHFALDFSTAVFAPGTIVF